jgi:hypothetical protein
MQIVDRTRIEELLAAVEARFDGEGAIQLVGETSQVVEGWRPWTTAVEWWLRVHALDREAVSRAVLEASKETGVSVIDEFPGDVVPLPRGVEERFRDLTLPVRTTRLTVSHFDPYGVCFRFIARGDERDYHLVLGYMHHGWVTEHELTRYVEGLLDHMSFETIQQDPAEFRRKYHGLLQMARALRPGLTHRPTAV